MDRAFYGRCIDLHNLLSCVGCRRRVADLRADSDAATAGSACGGAWQRSFAVPWNGDFGGSGVLEAGVGVPDLAVAEPEAKGVQRGRPEVAVGAAWGRTCSAT